MKVIFLFLTVAISLTSCADIVVDDRLPMIIDADTANEVDDLFAIVRAVVEPSIDFVGLTSAQFHISPLASDTTVLESQQMNEDILGLMGRLDIPHPVGGNHPMASPGQPTISDAVDFIINQAHQYTADRPLHLVILGSCTNVASAIVKDPTIIDKIDVDYIGFWHDAEINTYDLNEFNSGNDTVAVNVLLNTEDLDFNVMTATTCQHLVFEKERVLAELENSKDIGQYLIDRWDAYDRWWTEEDPQKLKWIMWDVAIIEALIHPELAVKETFTTPPTNTKRYIEAYTSIEVDAMIEDFWRSIKTEL